MSTAAATAQPGPTLPASRGRLARSLQEAFTVTVRLRMDKAVATDADQFRTRVKALLAGADQDARAAGYPVDLVRRAIYAFVAYLDESVLDSRQPMFSGWHGKPLQEEIFQDHLAGEKFFRHLRDLLSRQDSDELADTLEVYHLCLLLGFRGRMGGDEGNARGALVAEVGDKIRRIRGGPEPLAPSWALPVESLTPPKDPWIRTFALTAAGTLVLALLLLGLFTLLLSGAVGDVRSLAGAG